MFQGMISRVKEETLGILFRIQISEPDKINDLRRPTEQNLVYSGGDDAPQKKKPVKRAAQKNWKKRTMPMRKRKEVQKNAAGNRWGQGGRCGGPSETV